MQWPLQNSALKQLDNTLINSTTFTLSYVQLNTAAANTKSTYTQLLAASNANTSGSWIQIFCTTGAVSAVNQNALIDIAFGGSGSEVVAIPNISVANQSGTDLPSISMPFFIPPNTRVAARCQYNSAGVAPVIGIITYGGEPTSGLSTPQRAVDYGTVLASSRGTSLAPSNSASTKGAWVQLTASTTQPVHHLVIMPQIAGAASVNKTYTIDIGVGGSGSETAVFSNFAVQSDSAGGLLFYNPRFIPQNFSIPVGTRLSARCAVNGGGSTQPIYVNVLGLTY